MTSTTLNKTKFNPRAPEAVSTFIKKTFELLEDQKFPDIVDWNAEGTAIVIKKPTEFGQQVLPTYFKHNNLTSFVRQLNMYDFHKRRTQKYDHVYYHDLFQREKKNLLQEIKRKNQDTTLASIQKAIESLESAQGGPKGEANASVYENQLLKKLNKDAMARISTLENKIKELTVQNQSFYNQIVTQNQKEEVLVNFLASFMKKKGITLDELPKVLHNQFNIGPMGFGTDCKLFAKDLGNLKQETEELSRRFSMPVNVGDFLNFSEDLSNSTEISPSSPASKGQIEQERSADVLMMNDTQCKSEFSMLQNKNEEKNWKELDDINQKIDEDSFLGKRVYEEARPTEKRYYQAEKEDYWSVHKLVKRDAFIEANPFMIDGAKEELFDMKVKKFDSFMDMFGNPETHNNTCIDLMNFS